MITPTNHRRRAGHPHALAECLAVVACRRFAALLLVHLAWSTGLPNPEALALRKHRKRGSNKHDEEDRRIAYDIASPVQLAPSQYGKYMKFQSLMKFNFSFREKKT